MITIRKRAGPPAKKHDCCICERQLAQFEQFEFLASPCGRLSLVGERRKTVIPNVLATPGSGRLFTLWLCQFCVAAASRSDDPQIPSKADLPVPLLSLLA
jgi:hypothetical protein